MVLNILSQHNSCGRERLDGYGWVSLEKLTSVEKEKAKKILREDLFEKFDDTAIEAIARLDSNFALEVFTKFLNQVEIPNGASLDCAKFLYDTTGRLEYADIMIHHLYVSSRFYRRSAINAVSKTPATEKLIAGLKAIVFTDTDEVNVFVAANQLAARAGLSDYEAGLFRGRLQAASGENKRLIVEDVVGQIELVHS